MDYFFEIPTYIWLIFAFAVVFVSFWVWVNFFFSDENQRNMAQNKVKKYFNFLFDNGFFIDEVNANGPNGAWAVVAKSENYKIRIIQDRGDIFCEILPRWSNKYLDLSSIIASIEKKDEKLYYLQPNRNIDLQLEFYGKLLYSHNDQVSVFLENHFKPFATAFE